MLYVEYILKCDGKYQVPGVPIVPELTLHALKKRND